MLFFQIEANAIRNKIKNEITGKLVSLKLNIVSFFEINISFIVMKKIEIQILGVIELFERHTTENI